MLLIALFPLRNTHKAHGQSHYPNKIRRLISRKVTAWKQYRTFRTQELLAKYKAITSKCRSAIYSYHVNVENNVINSDNINKFYRYANRKFTNRSPIGSLKSNDGSTIIDPPRKAQLLQSIFTSMFTADNGHIPDVSTPPVTNTSLSNVIFTSVLVKHAICKLRLGPKVVLMAYHLSSSRLALTNSLPHYPISLQSVYGVQLPSFLLIGYVPTSHQYLKKVIHPVLLTTILLHLRALYVKSWRLSLSLFVTQ